jgi:uncharacterized membrane protein (DUF485 family)
MDQPRPDDIPHTSETMSDWDVVANNDEFKDLMAAKARFIVPATIFFIVYYFALPVLVGYAPAFMKRTVIGPVNIAYLFALSQFFMAWFIAWLYMRAARRFDAMGKSVLDHLQRHKDRQNGKGDS